MPLEFLKSAQNGDARTRVVAFLSQLSDPPKAISSMSRGEGNLKSTSSNCNKWPAGAPSPEVSAGEESGEPDGATRAARRCWFRVAPLHAAATVAKRAVDTSSSDPSSEGSTSMSFGGCPPPPGNTPAAAATVEKMADATSFRCTLESSPRLPPVAADQTVGKAGHHGRVCSCLLLLFLIPLLVEGLE